MIVVPHHVYHSNSQSSCSWTWQWHHQHHGTPTTTTCATATEPSWPCNPCTTIRLWEPRVDLRTGSEQPGGSSRSTSRFHRPSNRSSTLPIRSPPPLTRYLHRLPIHFPVMMPAPTTHLPFPILRSHPGLLVFHAGDSATPLSSSRARRPQQPFSH